MSLNPDDDVYVIWDGHVRTARVMSQQEWEKSVGSRYRNLENRVPIEHSFGRVGTFPPEEVYMTLEEAERAHEVQKALES